MPKIPRNWPPGALPRLMDVSCAAYYVGLSPNAFLTRVKAGTYPAPRRDGSRQLWDRAALDAAIDKKSEDANRWSVENLASLLHPPEEEEQTRRIMQAHLGGKHSHEIAIQEKLSVQKVAAIIRTNRTK